ncbi:MAG TPA: hypothetical protein VHT51_16275, partial [Micropepsaceae bacterium]|nr:hypothetical protein [Micropepsaceae bacterium]
MNHRVFFSGAISAIMVGVPAFADDLTISTGTATAVTTATAANSTPGNITIGSSGSVTIAAAGAAVTLNSNNVVVNNGTISNTVDTSAVGVQINAGNSGSFTNNGAIKIPGNGTPPTSTGLFGVLLNGTGVFTGDIVTTSGSTITISGLSANAIAIQSELNGKLTQGGTITSSGSLSNGVITSALIDGAFTNTGTITTDRGTGNTGTVNPGSPV